MNHTVKSIFIIGTRCGLSEITIGGKVDDCICHGKIRTVFLVMSTRVDVGPFRDPGRCDSLISGFVPQQC